MNSEEIKDIRTTWEIPRASPTDSGAAILIKFFTKYPSNLQYFPFKDVPIAELNSSPRFRAHCGRIIRVFEESIQTLDQDDCAAKLNEIWEEIATTHFKRHITRQSYNELREAVVEVLGVACKLNDQQAASWNKLLDIIYSIIFTRVEQLELAQ